MFHYLTIDVLYLKVCLSYLKMPPCHQPPLCRPRPSSGWWSTWRTSQRKGKRYLSWSRCWPGTWSGTAAETRADRASCTAFTCTMFWRKTTARHTRVTGSPSNVIGLRFFFYLFVHFIIVSSSSGRAGAVQTWERRPWSELLSRRRLRTGFSSGNCQEILWQHRGL